MKTPRLALFALLVCASAADAALPTWPVIEEGPRAWVRVSFTVGTEPKTLRCRYNECKPEVKGISNLYTITPVGAATPTKVTIYKMVERGRWNPRYYTDGPYAKVPEVIDAKAQPYSSELSHFKLDNTGAQLVVVQGTNKFPASTDINERQWNSYDQLKVAPPTKMIDDVLRPDAPAAQPARPAPADRPGTAPAAKWWCDPTTGEKYSAARGRSGSIQLASQSAECKKAVTEITAPPVVVTPPPAETVASLALTAEEIRWLTKFQAADYARIRALAAAGDARKAVDARHRALVEAQIRPEAKSAYAAAHALPPAEAPAKISEAIGRVEMWGGKDAKDIKAIVENFQETADPATVKLLEIQLSKADWELLRRKPEDLQKYIRARDQPNGASGTPPAFNSDYVDPVALRLSVVAARAAIGAASPEASPEGEAPDGAAPVPPLTEDEKKLLTPAELAVYRSIFDSANGDPKDPNLQREAARLRELIASEKRGEDPAYAAPSGLDAFNQLPEWQKRKFCEDLAKSGANLGADGRAPELGGTGGALDQLAQTDGRSAAPATTTTTTSDAPADWTTQACNPYRAPPITAGPTTRPPVTADVPTPAGVTVGDDTEVKDKEKSKWLTRPLITSAIKGGLIGLLIGSLFGPIGLIAGPLLGAAISYGLTKVTTP